MMQARFFFGLEDVYHYQRFGARYLPWTQRMQLPMYQSLYVALLFWIGAAVFFLVLASPLPIGARLMLFGGQP
jgi:hypothetical protein